MMQCATKDTRETPERHLGAKDTWETPGSKRHPGDTWEQNTPGRHLEATDTWETPGRHPGDTWETPGRHLGLTWELLELFLRGDQALEIIICLSGDDKGSSERFLLEIIGEVLQVSRP